MKFSSLALLIVALTGLMTAPTKAAERPNIIFLLADDLGYNELGCYGQKWIETPNIDRMAATGMRFTQFYAGAPVCAPSRCTLLTGYHTGHAYVRNNREIKPEGQEPIPDETVTVAELLKQQGYATAAIGKWGLGGPGSTGDPNQQGFDLFFGYNCQRHAHNHYPTYLWRNDRHVELEGNSNELSGAQFSQDLFAREALQFIRDNQDGPFFLYLPFTIPHLSIQVPDESLAQYRNKIPEEPYEHTAYLKHPFPRAGYAAMISHLDRDIGKIMALLDELSIDDNTLVFFSSDNGPTYDRLGGTDSIFFESNKPFSGFKGSVNEGGIRVPLVARWPGHIEPGTTSDHVAAFWDVLPTLCDVAGTPSPETIDGISFAPALFGRAQREHDFLYWEFAAYGGQQAVRSGPWKAIRQNMFRGDLSVQLFNLDDDVAELHDVADQHPEIVARMKRIMSASHTPSKVFPFRQIDD